MFDFLTKAAAKILGSKSEKDLKQIVPYVGKINTVYEKLKALTDDALREETEQVRTEIGAHLKNIDDELTELHKQIADRPEMDISEKETIFEQIDKLEENRNKALEEVLLQVLPHAFAIVKETARRFKENGRLTVRCTPHDERVAMRKSNVQIEGEQAIWHNKWMAAGNEITWNMLHYDVQLVGGVVLHEGKIAEMATGEGKTLVATLPAFLNALAKRGVHIVTVNDYLAKRDAEWMAPLMEFHGLTVDCIDKYEPHSPERKRAYACDITYGTNNEFGFDYLRDNMAREVADQVQRKHHFAMVDEVDSVLVDDARTPLIISGPVPKGDEHEFTAMKPRVSQIFEQQKKLVTGFLNDAKRKIAEGNQDEGGLSLLRAHRGLPKFKPLIKYLGEPGIKIILQKTENFYLQDNQKEMPKADKPLLFTIDEKNNLVELSEKGIDTITKSGEDKNFFILPDISVSLQEVEQDDALTDEEKLKKSDEITNDFVTKSQRIHTVSQLLKAYALFEKDVDYIIVDSKIKIVDEQTGRAMEGRRYSDGLHQALEAKENVKIEDATQTYATITLQNYFRMYHKLSGMTGTAETEAKEFWEIYKLDVVVIPTNRPIQRDDRQDKVFKTIREKYNAVIDEITEMVDAKRPVLVGTTSVEYSELLSRFLQRKGIKHQVLNAKQHAREAEVVANAGLPATVTIATNMAGRGTDIKLTPESKDAGGLAIIGTERHESRRVDRQLRGRAGRQGDPGSSQFFVSLEDNLMRLFGSDSIAKIMDRLGLQEGEVIQHSMITKSIERAQKKVEENNFSSRKRLLEYDDVMNSQREVIYKRRTNALYGERLQLDIMNAFYEVANQIISTQQAEYENFRLEVFKIFGMKTEIDEKTLQSSDSETVVKTLFEEAMTHYKEKNSAIVAQTFPVIKDVYENKGATVKEIIVPFTNNVNQQLAVAENLEKAVNSGGKSLIDSMQQAVSLSLIDQEWKEHLRDMDEMKEQVQNARYQQKDPLLIYKFEAFELFKSLLHAVNENTVSFLAKATLPITQADEVREAREMKPRKRVRTRAQKADSGSTLSTNRPNTEAVGAETQDVEITKPIRKMKMPNRNQRVTVRYNDGTLKKDVKFKTVEKDIASQNCVLVQA